MTGFLLLFAQQMSGKPDFEFTGLPEQSLLDRAASQLPHNPSLLLVSVVGAWFLLLGLLLGLLLSIRYRVGPRHFIVTLLGVPVRRVRLDNIKYMNTAAPALAEAWHCRLFPPPHSILVIRKRRGFFKNLVVTPPQRYLLMAEINRARDALVASEGLRLEA